VAPQKEALHKKRYRLIVRATNGPKARQSNHRGHVICAISYPPRPGVYKYKTRSGLHAYIAFSVRPCDCAFRFGKAPVVPVKRPVSLLLASAVTDPTRRHIGRGSAGNRTRTSASTVKYHQSCTVFVIAVCSILSSNRRRDVTAIGQTIQKWRLETFGSCSGPCSGPQWPPTRSH
jgi:hypothetical protein